MGYLSSLAGDGVDHMLLHHNPLSIQMPCKVTEGIYLFQSIKIIVRNTHKSLLLVLLYMGDKIWSF